MRWFYLSMALLGAALPYSQFLPWILDHGLNVPLMIRELFSTRVSAFFALDVILSAITLIAFIRRDPAARRGRLRWPPIAATLLIGVSCGLPLFLYLRERHNENGSAA